ncbi:MAG: ATP-dependent RNA helicase DbpA [Gammaproteobacteria bacterium]|nr:ATP-dependent RNA helicase DbpA [Gammaproteobacteria bacterium]
MSQTTFSSLQLSPSLLKNLSTLSYHFMTPIQAQSLPHILTEKDVIAQGKTGSGKTAAFGLGLLHKLDVKYFRIQALVLCPTRELADQVSKEIRRLARAVHNIKVLTICGGMPFGPQLNSLEHGAHIIVGTPGRIEDHLSRGTLKLDNVNTLVLDEADRMLDMGFQSSLDAIIDQIPGKHQTLLFSATFPDKIRSISERVMKHPTMVKVESTHDDNSITQHFYKTDDKERMNALRLLLLQHHPESSIVFCNTKRETQQVADKLNHYGFSVLALHGDLEQRDRDLTLTRFTNKSISILVATDVAARGLDIDAVDAVFNYHMAHDTETHIHRIGRTGRAGSVGVAYSLFDEDDDFLLALLGEAIDQVIESKQLPPKSILSNEPIQAQMITLQIDGGKKQKLRPGDILGALTGENGIEAKQVGKIQINANGSYVAVNKEAAQSGIKKLSQGKLKGRSFRVRKV